MVHYEKRRIVQQVEVKLAPFTDQLRHVKEENEYNEFDLQRLNKQLTEFREELIKCSNVAFEEDPQALIKNVHISISMSGERQGKERRAFISRSIASREKHCRPTIGDFI